MATRSLIQGKGEQVSGKSASAPLFRRLVLLCGAIVFITTVLAYTPAIKNDFVNWDDYAYVYENSYIHSLSPRSFYWMLTSFHATNWHPLTWLSHGVDCALFGLDPSGHHLTSIMLHGLNTLLVFLLAIKLMLTAQAMNKAPSPSTGSFSRPHQALIAGGVTALFFGVHPIHVESVAWLAERKDVLCALFFLLALCSYLFYTAAADTRNRRTWFAACLLLTGAALMAKPMAVTLPLVLLLLDIYPLRRITRYAGNNNLNPGVLLEKVPFVFLCVCSGVVTILAQHAGGAFETLERLPLGFRLLNALYSPLFYLAKMFWPRELVPFYPFPHVISSLELTFYIISGILTLGVTGLCLWSAQKRRYVFFTVWTYYLITLFPVLGIIQVGSQAAADRYTYLPSAGIFALAGLGVAQVLAGTPTRRSRMILGGLVVAVILAALGRMTMQQITVWQDSETLWRSVIKNFPGRVPIAHNNLGVLYDRQGMYDRAMEEYEKAIAINSTFADALSNLGQAYHRRGGYDKAIEEYQKALAANPALVEARNNLGLAYYAQGSHDKAVEEYKKLLAIQPDLAEARYNLGLAYYAQERYDEAIEEYERVLSINPAFADAHYKLALAYYTKKNYALAAIHFDKARKLGYKVDPKLEALIKQAP